MEDTWRQAEIDVARGFSSTANSSAIADSADSLYSYDTALVSGILKTKRKARSIKACFPCRSRKVRCDGRVPCTKCVQRDHASLCRRAPAAQGASSGHSGYAHLLQADQSPASTILTSPLASEAARSRAQSLQLMVARMGKLEKELSLLKDGLVGLISADEMPSSSSPEDIPALVDASLQPQNAGHGAAEEPERAPGKFCVDAVTGTAVFLGSHSDHPSVLGCFQPSSDCSANQLLPDYLMPKTYAFANLWAEVSVARVCQSLPSDSDVIRYWEAYKSLVHPFYPALVTAERFGCAILSFLDSRSKADSDALERLYAKTDASWLGLMFAVLASGVQFSEDLAKERELRSKVFVCSAFQCLRASNVLSYVSGDQIQAMALIGLCLRNNLDMNGAWVIMAAYQDFAQGSTIRLAQSIGLHEASDPAKVPLLPPPWVIEPAPHQARMCLWWTLVWQDTFLSMTYDRPPGCISAARCALPQFPPRTRGGGKAFADFVSEACQVFLHRTVYMNYIVPQTADYDSYKSFLQCKNRFELVREEATSLLSADDESCGPSQGRLEYLTLQIHVGYSICRLYHELLAEKNLAEDCAALASLQGEYISEVVRVIESFLQLIRLSPLVCRSWPLVHNAVSPLISAKSLLRSTGRLESSQGRYLSQLDPLVQSLIEVLEKEDQMSRWLDEDGNVRVLGPYTRVLRALKDVCRNAL